VRPPDIVVGDPSRNLGAGVIQIEEQGLVEQFIAHSAVETLVDAADYDRNSWLQRAAVVS
jgi:hypothetical protein